MTSFCLTSYNIHKGMSPLNRKVILPKLAQALAKLRPDVLCLQEVSGQNQKQVQLHDDYPAIPQDEWLAKALHCTAHYGKNASYAHGHHGNATLTRHHSLYQNNLDLTVNRLEWRGLLHSEINIDGSKLIVLNTHLNLRHCDRIKQYQAIANYIHQAIDQTTPLVLAGDFNDWHRQADGFFADLGLYEVFGTHYGKHASTFPAKMPVLTLDRIYIKNLTIQSAIVHTGKPWSSLSDHLPITAVLEC